MRHSPLPVLYQDFEVPGYVAPSMADLASEVNATLGRCPDHRRHHTLAEPPPRGHPKDGPCHVNPFVLHGYYAKYLRPWAAAFGHAQHGGHLLVLDFERIGGDGARVLEEVTAFLGLPPHAYDVGQVFNTRENRGVHAKATTSRYRGRATRTRET